MVVVVWSRVWEITFCGACGAYCGGFEAMYVTLCRVYGCRAREIVGMHTCATRGAPQCREHTRATLEVTRRTGAR